MNEEQSETTTRDSNERGGRSWEPEVPAEDSCRSWRFAADQAADRMAPNGVVSPTSNGGAAGTNGKALWAAGCPSCPDSLYARPLSRPSRT